MGKKGNGKNGRQSPSFAALNIGHEKTRRGSIAGHQKGELAGATAQGSNAQKEREKKRRGEDRKRLEQLGRGLGPGPP